MPYVPSPASQAAAITVANNMAELAEPYTQLQTDVVTNHSLQLATILEGSTGSAFYQTIQANGTPVTQEPIFNFSSNFTITPDPSNNRTNIAIAGGSSGTVTSVATDSTLTGGPITTTGTLGLNLSNANTWTATQSFHNILPSATNTWSIGSASSIFADGYFGVVSGNAGIVLSDSSSQNTTLTFTSTASTLSSQVNTIQSTAADNTGSFGLAIYSVNEWTTSNLMLGIQNNNTLVFSVDPSGNVFTTGTVSSENLLPLTTNTYQVGTSSLQWQDGYFNNLHIDGYNINLSHSSSGQALIYNGTAFVPTSFSAGVSSVSNGDGTLTISPTTGPVVASLALGHANSWIATQTFKNIASTTDNTYNIGATSNAFNTGYFYNLFGNAGLELADSASVNSYINLTSGAAAVSAPLVEIASAGTTSIISSAADAGTSNALSIGSSATWATGNNYIKVINNATTIFTLNAAGTVNSQSHLPLTTATYSLGSSTEKWKDGYFSGKISLDGYNLDLTAGAVSGQSLTYNGTAFVASTAGTVTSVATGAGLSGGTITTTGTLTLDLTHANTWSGQQTFGTSGPIFSAGLTASGSTANDFSGSSGTFKTSTGASTFGGSANTFTNGIAVLATTNQLTLGAAAHEVIISSIAPSAASQTLTIPDTGGNDTFAFLGQAQTFKAPQTITPTNGLFTTLDGYLTLSTGTAATSTNTVQYSPGMVFEGQAWNTTSSASNKTDWMIVNKPVSGTSSTLNSYLTFNQSLNGSAYSTELSMGNQSLFGNTQLTIADSSSTNSYFLMYSSLELVTTGTFIIDAASTTVTGGFIGPNYGGTSTNVPTVTWLRCDDGGSPSYGYKNSYVNYGGSYGATRFYKDVNGIIHMIVSATAGTAGDIIFTLPAGYIPISQLLIPCSVDSDTVWGCIYIDTSGNVRTVSGGHTYVLSQEVTWTAAS